MTWTLADVLGTAALTVTRECKTGKTPFATKDEARRALSKQRPQHEQRPMHAYRCEFCERYHLGHHRGTR